MKSKYKVLIVEDNQKESEYAKTIIEKYNQGNFGRIYRYLDDERRKNAKTYLNEKGKITPIFTSNLADALKIMHNEEINDVITDVFYPLGNASNKEELSEIVRDGMSVLHSCRDTWTGKFMEKGDGIFGPDVSKSMLSEEENHLQEHCLVCTGFMKNPICLF